MPPKQGLVSYVSAPKVAHPEVFSLSLIQGHGVVQRLHQPTNEFHNESGSAALTSGQIGSKKENQNSGSFSEKKLLKTIWEWISSLGPY